MLILANVEATNGIKVSAKLLENELPILDALVEGISIVERDPKVRSVGYGGWPNMIGEMEFDAAVMDGTSRQIGAVGALQDSLSAVKVAREVMLRLPHVVLTSAGASRFAKECGFEPEAVLMPDSKRVWRNKIEKTVAPNLIDQFPNIPLAPLSNLITDPERVRDTTVFLGKDDKGDIAVCTSTSGWAWKYPGRLGDSPIPGAGFYADSRYGAAACTHTGEMTMRTSTARCIILAMQLGRSLEDAIKLAIEDLALLKGGFLGGVVIHAMDANENYQVINFNCSETIRYWVWRDGMRTPEQKIAEKHTF
ncbi:MAG: N(4)-(beta-N-acetylglucosaminyl)-L-asparaginase [Rhizobiales bacterium]|nr:N(4)-(beta-N-acetylglucosaminyl)-L-asparaginase [Hyphomicrobiales bacterium]